MVGADPLCAQAGVAVGRRGCKAGVGDGGACIVGVGGAAVAVGRNGFSGGIDGVAMGRAVRVGTSVGGAVAVAGELVGGGAVSSAGGEVAVAAIAGGAAVSCRINPPLMVRRAVWLIAAAVVTNPDVDNIAGVMRVNVTGGAA